MEIRAAKQQGSLLATHTPGLHGESHRVVAKDFDPSRDAKNDFALIPLDERITGITPLRLPTSDCPDPLEGAFYGFGEGAVATNLKTAGFRLEAPGIEDGSGVRPNAIVH